MLLTNVPERIIEIKEVGRLGTSDHTMIQASIEISRSEAKTTEKVPNWGEADWGAMSAELCRKDWGKMLDCGIVDETWRTFRDTKTGLGGGATRGMMRALRKKKKLWK
jgi:hypothetical protein